MPRLKCFVKTGLFQHANAPAAVAAAGAAYSNTTPRDLQTAAQRGHFVPFASVTATVRPGKFTPWPTTAPSAGLLAFGPDIRPGATVEEAGIVDIAPTVAHVLGFDMPDTDGRVVEEILR